MPTPTRRRQHRGDGCNSTPKILSRRRERTSVPRSAERYALGTLTQGRMEAQAMRLCLEQGPRQGDRGMEDVTPSTPTLLRDAGEEYGTP
jgi:hypothetical protein